MKSRSVKEILSEAMPEMQIVEPTSRSIDSANQADAASETRPGPSIDALRAKFLGQPANRSAANQDSSANDVDDDDVEVVQVRPKALAADFTLPSTPKTVIVSKTKGVIGRQG